MTEKIKFTNQRGDELHGFMELPRNREPEFYAIFAHCFTCGKDNFAAEEISKTLAIEGIGVLRFDFAGIGDSQGEFKDTTFSQYVGDLFSAVEFLNSVNKSPSLMIGHSLGGTAVLAAARYTKSIKAISTIGSPYDPAHVLDNIHFSDHPEKAGECNIKIGGRNFQLKKEFFADIEQQSSQLGNVLNPHFSLLVMHAPKDKVVEVENAREIFSHAIHPKSYISLDVAAHLLPRKEDAQYTAKIISTWSRRYIKSKPETILSNNKNWNCYFIGALLNSKLKLCPTISSDFE